MRKIALAVFSVILIVVLFFATFSTASAAKGNLPDPTVTPVTGDADFAVTIVPIASLPGSVEGANGKIYPVGYETGDKQFGGSGVAVTGLDGGTASACFSFEGVTNGWGGQVARWDGVKWVMLPTAISTPDESQYSFACATISGNGTYVLLRWVADLSLLPSFKACNYSVKIFPIYSEITGDTGTFDGFYFYSKSMHEGMVVTMQTLYIVPLGSWDVTGVGSGVTVEVGPDAYLVRFDTPMQSVFHNYTSTEWAITTTIDDCIRTLRWPDDYQQNN